MKDYKSELRWKIQKYGKKCAGHDRLMALRLGFWNFRFALTGWRRKRFSSEGKTLKIGFELSGGLGDYLIALNYVEHFKRFLGEVPNQIDLFTESSKQGLVQNLSGLMVGSLSALERLFDYDLVISIRRFPKIEWVNAKKISKQSPKLLELVNSYKDFERSRTAIFTQLHFSDAISNQHSLCAGKLRIEQPDIGERLGVGVDYIATISYPQDERNVLKRFSLPEKFITLNRGVDTANKSPNNVKMWPLEYYNALIPKLKERFPDVPLVQIGASIERSPLMDGIDIPLVGKTSLDDLKVILKRSFLHFDGEGGMVHLRHALRGGPSVVFFGPTSREFYGYPENRNLRSEICSWCEWIHDDWNGVCLRTGSQAACMTSLTPEKVLSELSDFL